MKTQNAFLSCFKICALTLLTLVMTINISEAYARVNVGLGVGIAPAPVPAYAPSVVYVPGHWYNGYWVPAQYVENVPPQPGPGFVWVGGYYDGAHHYHRGYWNHHYRRHH